MQVADVRSAEIRGISKHYGHATKGTQCSLPKPAERRSGVHNSRISCVTTHMPHTLLSTPSSSPRHVELEGAPRFPGTSMNSAGIDQGLFLFETISMSSTAGCLPGGIRYCSWLAGTVRLTAEKNRPIGSPNHVALELVHMPFTSSAAAGSRVAPRTPARRSTLCRRRRPAPVPCGVRLRAGMMDSDYQVVQSTRPGES
jgi:hypothetical protein